MIKTQKVRLKDLTRGDYFIDEEYDKNVICMFEIQEPNFINKEPMIKALAWNKNMLMKKLVYYREECDKEVIKIEIGDSYN